MHNVLYLWFKKNVVTVEVFCGVLDGVGNPPIHPHAQHMHLSSSANAC